MIGAAPEFLKTRKKATVAGGLNFSREKRFVS
jgi:hypothetical protein